MGIKHLVLVFITIICAVKAQCQITVAQFEVIASWDSTSGTVFVTEKLQFEGASSETEVTLQSLTFRQSKIEGLKINDSISIPLNKNVNGLLTTRIPIGESRSLQLNYFVRTQSNELIIPLIFTSIVAPNSTEDLFSATLKIPLHFKLVESFPTIVGDGEIQDDQRIYKVELPVIPSLLKANLADESKFVFGNTEILDGFVLITLLVLGVVGWRKRKMLI